MRKQKAKEPRVEARVSLVGFDFSQPHAVPDRTTDRRHRQPSSDIPEAKPCRDSRRAWWAHPNRRMLYAANPDGGTVVSVHVDTGRCSRTAGRGRSTPSPRNKLPSFRVLHFTSVCRSGGRKHFASRIGRPVGGWRRARGGREGSSSPERLRAHFLAPRRRKRDGHAVDRPRRIPDTRRSTSPGRLRPRLGRFTSRT